MATLWAHADEALRSDGRHAVDSERSNAVPVAILFACSCLVYGAAMGTWSERPLQMLYSGLKVPLLGLGTSLVCLPSFFVFNTVLGLRSDFGRALRGIVAFQTTFALALVGLIPLVAFAYANGIGYGSALLINGLAFLGASLAGQLSLARHYAPLIRAEPKHRAALLGWLVLYQFVAIQLAWSLRPFVGRPTMEPEFLRPDSWTNAYVDIVQAILRAFKNGI